MYRGDLGAGWCAREGVGARTQRAGRQAPDRTEPFGSLLEPDEREPTQKSKNARSDGGDEGLACAAVGGTPRLARGTGRARRESDGVLFCVWRLKTSRSRQSPTHKKKSPTTRARARAGVAPDARARARRDVRKSALAATDLCTEWGEG